MSFKQSRLLWMLLALAVGCSSAAWADTCVPSLPEFSCGTGHPNVMRLTGTATNLPVGLSFSGSDFSVYTANGKRVHDVIIAAIFPNTAVTGSANGLSFSSVDLFPEKGALGAALDTLISLGFCTGKSSCDLNFGFVDLDAGIARGGSLLVNLENIPAGTIFYALGANRFDVIRKLTPNSEAALYQPDSGTQVPEPASLLLLSTGLVGAGWFGRKRKL